MITPVLTTVVIPNIYMPYNMPFQALNVLRITSHKLLGKQEKKKRVNRNLHIPGTFTDGFSDIPGMG
jgi:hypothetical protein